MSTCFISRSSSLTKEISSPFLFTESTNVIFQGTEGRKQKKGYFFSSFCPASNSFLPIRLFNMQLKFYLFSFLFCCSLHLNSQKNISQSAARAFLTLALLKPLPIILSSHSEHYGFTQCPDYRNEIWSESLKKECVILCMSQNKMINSMSVQTLWYSW